MNITTICSIGISFFWYKNILDIFIGAASCLTKHHPIKTHLIFPQVKLAFLSPQKQSGKSYLDYAMSVIVSRALPDVRDGLKPVHRRILYAMMEGGYDWSKAYRKSARVVGDVMGNYHPHGDSAIYESMVRMAQDFSMRVTLVDGQGNFGSVDGDLPAAMRYRIASGRWLLRHYCVILTGIRLILSRTMMKPKKSPVLPAEYPNLLVNGGRRYCCGYGHEHSPA